MLYRFRYDPVEFCLTEEHGTKVYYEPAATTERGSTTNPTTEAYWRIDRVVDPNGNVIQYNYSSSAGADPTLPTAIDSEGPDVTSRQILFGYSTMSNGAQRLTSVTDPDGQVYTYEYTLEQGVEMLTSVSKPAVADPYNGGTSTSPYTSFTYDISGPTLLLQAKSNGSDPWESHQLITWYLPASITDARGTSGDDSGATTSFGYTSPYPWEPSSLDDDNGELIEVWQQTPKLTSVTTPDGTARFAEISHTLTPADTSLETEVTDTNGNTTTFDFTGSVVSNPSSIAGFAIVYTNFTRSIPVTDADGATTTKTLDYQYSPDIYDNLTSVTDMSGNVIQFQYGTTANKLYDNPSAMILNSGGLALTTTYEYDSTFQKQIQQTDPAGEVTEYTLDSAGNRTSQTVAAGTASQAVTDYGYAADGFQTSMTDPTGRVTDYAQDQYGNLASTTIAGFSGSTPIVTSQTSDAMGNVLTKTDADGNVTDYAYNGWNQVTATTSAAGTSDATTTFNFYDFDGNLVETVNPDGHVTINTYDRMDRLASTRVRMDSDDSDSSDDLVTSYGYDRAGNQTSVTDPDGNTTTTVYDALLRPIETLSPNVTVDANPDDTSADPAPATTQYVTRDFYGANSGSGAFTFGGFNPTEVIDPRGTVTDITYNGAYQKTSVTQSGGGASTETDYVNNADGKVVQTTVDNSDGGGNRITYTLYDDQMRPTVSVVDMGGAIANPTATVDNPATFSAGGGDLVTATFYAANGNVTATTDPNGNTTTFGYDNANRKTSTTLPEVSTFTLAGGTAVTSPTTYTAYDPNGNVTKTTDANGNVTTTAYDALNLPTETTIGYGSLDLTTHYAYDPAGNKTSVTDPNGNVTLTAYDFDNRPTQVIAPEIANAAAGGAMQHPVTTTAYDKDGNVTSVTDPDGIVTTTTYDQMNRPRFVTENATATTGSSDQLITEKRYDADGNVVAQVLYNNVDGTVIPQVTDYTYDGLNRKTSMAQPAPGSSEGSSQPTTYYTYDQAGDQLSAEDPDGNTTTYAYDLDGRKISVTQPAPGGSEGTSQPVTTYGYDADGNQTSVTDPDSHTTNYVYNADNEKTESIQPSPDGSAPRPTTTTDYDADGNVTAVIDPDGNQTDYTFDADNRKTAMIQPTPAGVAGEGPETTYAYDQNGNETAVTDPVGNVTTYTFDALNEKITETDPVPSTGVASPVTQYGYNLDGELVEQTDPLDRVTNYEYDGLKRKTEVIEPSPDGTSARPTTTTTYDSAGNTLSTTDPNENTTIYTYDNLNRKISETDPAPSGGSDPSITTWQYDADGNKISMTDALGNASGGTASQHTTNYTYDNLDREVGEQDPAPTPGGARPTTTMTYDAAGNQLTLTDANGNTTTYGYDDDNRQISNTDQLDHPSTTTYDAAGNITSTTDRDGRTITYTYDALNRKISENWIGTGGSTISTTTYGYDADSRMTSSSDPSATTTYSYDGDGRVTTKVLGYAGLFSDVTLASGYDADSELTGLATTIGTTADLADSYTYNNLGDTISAEQSGVTGGNSVAPELVNMSYDADQNLVGMDRYDSTTASSGSLAVASTMDYDGDNNMTALDYALGTTGATVLDYTYGYDVASRMTTQTTPDGTSDFTYDNDNQLLSASNTGEAYTYDLAGNRTSATLGSGTSGTVVPGTDNEISSDATYNYTYDNEGNLTERVAKDGSGSDTYTWDYRNRLTEVVSKNGSGVTTQTVQYTYDDNNDRISQTVTNGSGTVTLDERYIYDSNGNLLEVLNSSGNVTERELNGPNEDQELASEVNVSGSAAGTTHWLLGNNEGSIEYVTDPTGTVLDHTQYDTFGNIVTQTSAADASRFGYTGQQQDAATGLEYDHARYYNPQTGAFLSQDPKGFAAGDDNLYTYVGNDPLTKVDPTGMDVADALNSDNLSFYPTYGTSQPATAPPPSTQPSTQPTTQPASTQLAATQPASTTSPGTSPNSKAPATVGDTYTATSTGTVTSAQTESLSGTVAGTTGTITGTQTETNSPTSASIKNGVTATDAINEGPAAAAGMTGGQGGISSANPGPTTKPDQTTFGVGASNTDTTPLKNGVPAATTNSSELDFSAEQSLELYPGLSADFKDQYMLTNPSSKPDTDTNTASAGLAYGYNIGDGITVGASDTYSAVTTSGSKTEAWRERITLQQASGQSIRAWCRENDCHEHAFYWWRRRLGLSPIRDAGTAGMRRGRPVKAIGWELNRLPGAISALIVRVSVISHGFIATATPSG